MHEEPDIPNESQLPTAPQLTFWEPSHVQRNGLAYALLIVMACTAVGMLLSMQIASDIWQTLVAQGSIAVGALAAMGFSHRLYR